MSSCPSRAARTCGASAHSPAPAAGPVAHLLTGLLCSSIPVLQLILRQKTTLEVRLVALLVLLLLKLVAAQGAVLQPALGPGHWWRHAVLRPSLQARCIAWRCSAGQQVAQQAEQCERLEE